jgi:hypothetical protein
MRQALPSPPLEDNTDSNGRLAPKLLSDTGPLCPTAGPTGSPAGVSARSVIPPTVLPISPRVSTFPAMDVSCSGPGPGPSPR